MPWNGESMSACQRLRGCVEIDLTCAHDLEVGDGDPEAQHMCARDWHLYTMWVCGGVATAGNMVATLRRATLARSALAVWPLLEGRSIQIRHFVPILAPIHVPVVTAPLRIRISLRWYGKGCGSQWTAFRGGEAVTALLDDHGQSQGNCGVWSNFNLPEFTNRSKRNT